MLKHIVQFSAWQALAQVVSTAMVFLLAAVLPSGPLATFGYALSISSVLSNCATLRIEQAVLVAETDDDAFRLAWAAQFVSLLVCAITVLAMWLIQPAGGVAPVLAGALAALSLSSVTISQQVLIRIGHSPQAGAMATVRAALTALLVLAAVVFSNRASSNGALLGLGTGAALVTATCLLELRRNAHLTWNLGDYKKTILAYRDVWPSYLGQSVLSGLSLNAPYLAFFYSVDHQLVASYLLADRVARTPIALVSISIRSHLTHSYSHLVRDQRSAEGDRLMNRWSFGLAITGLLGLVSAGLVIYALGARYSSQKWAWTGGAVIVLAPWAASTLSNSPAKAALTAFRKNAYIFNVQAAELVARLMILALILPIIAEHFFLGLFLVHLPGVALNWGLHARAARAWRLTTA